MFLMVMMNVSDVSQPQFQLGNPASHCGIKKLQLSPETGSYFLSDVNINILPELLGETISLYLRNITAVIKKRDICTLCYGGGGQ